jgi:hypothetical protein
MRSTVRGSVVSSAVSRGMMRPAVTSGVSSTTMSTAFGERNPWDDEQCRNCGDYRKLAAHGTVSSMLNPMRKLKSSAAEPEMND